MKTVRLTESSFGTITENMLKRSTSSYPKQEAAVKEILENVRTNRDQAVFSYTKQFDGATVSARNIRITEKEEKEAYKTVGPELVGIIRKALANIRTYHERQIRQSWFSTTEDGTLLGQKVTALNRVGVYVPGGKAAYPSTVLMNIVPRKSGRRSAYRDVHALRTRRKSLSDDAGCRKGSRSG